MTAERREQGETRQQIIDLLRRNGPMTAAELSTGLGIGAVGVRQHLALLERDNLVSLNSVRRGVGRPSHLYALTEEAESLFPKRYDRFALEALEFLKEHSGESGVEAFFAKRRAKLADQYKRRLGGKNRAEQVAELAAILSEQGYMCEWNELDDGSFELIEHNCPLDCVARTYRQACSHELTLYEDVLGTAIVREEVVTQGGSCCRYRISNT